MNNKLVIVDDETDMRNGLQRLLRREFPGMEVVALADGESAIEFFAKEKAEIALLDIRMAGMSGLDLLQHLLGKNPWLTAIIMTGFGSIEVAVQSIKLGAYDFITKPFDREILVRTVSKAIERSRLLRENTTLKEQVCGRVATHGFVGRSTALNKFLGHLEIIGKTGYTVLVRGASGTGKELTARALHSLSDRKHKPLVMVNCPAIPEHLLESELFGYVRGAFTNADRDQQGLVAAADGGTLCLDEVGDLPMAIQSKLLRVLQEREIKPLGSTKTIKVDIRVIAMTNRNLEGMIAEKIFREDLFHRLNGITLLTPTLHQLAEDIPMLVAHFTEKICLELNCPGKQFEQEAITLLAGRPWPGNVRELENVVRRAIMFSPNPLITTADLDFLEPSAQDCERTDATFEEDGVFRPYKEAKERVLQRFTQDYVAALLNRTSGNISQGAEISGISRVALQKIMKREEISGADFRP
jgi:DNA-binding NtrC family response regulator